ncbi:MAG: hypothetical protein GEU92_06690 [Alphaproteobacteria bacterium]|nr:hypothetical protein [Alphaproteobacteria bacterium]
MLVVPPGLPKERLEFLQATARTVLTDPEFVDNANKKKRYVEFVDPETTKKMMLNVISNISPEKKAEVRKVILGK